MPTISVVIPVYNCEKYVGLTIRSVLAQTFKDIEIIVINDGSTDSTLNIVRDIPDPRIRVYSYENAGLAASRNRGIAQAMGNFITFIDADDLWTTDKLEGQLRVLQHHTVPAVAYSWTDYIDEEGKLLSPGSHITALGDIYSRLLTIHFIESGSNILVPKEFFLKTGVFDESLRLAEDWEMCVRLAKHYHFVAVGSPQILYRISNGSMSSNLWLLKNASQETVEKVFSQAPRSLLSSKEKIYFNLYLHFITKSLIRIFGVKRGLILGQGLWRRAHRCADRHPSWLAQAWPLKFVFNVLLAISAVIDLIKGGTAHNKRQSMSNLGQ